MPVFWWSEIYIYMYIYGAFIGLYTSIYIYISLSLSPSLYLPIYLSVYPSIHPSIYRISIYSHDYIVITIYIHTHQALQQLNFCSSIPTRSQGAVREPRSFPWSARAAWIYSKALSPYPQPENIDEVPMTCWPHNRLSVPTFSLAKAKASTAHSWAFLRDSGGSAMTI